MRSDDYNIKQCILDYAQNHEQFEINQLVTELKMKINTARQYLSTLTKNKQIVRIGNGTYSLPNKQIFKFVPNDDLLKIHQELKAKFSSLPIFAYTMVVYLPNTPTSCIS